MYYNSVKPVNIKSIINHLMIGNLDATKLLLPCSPFIYSKDGIILNTRTWVH